MRLYIALAIAAASLASAQVYSPFISPDGGLYNYSGDQSGTTYLATTDVRQSVSTYNSAQCTGNGLIGDPGSYGGMYIGGRLGYHIVPPIAPQCGPLEVDYQSYETTWLAGSYPDHLGQGLGVTALGGLPAPPAPPPGSTPAIAQDWEACSLISNIGLGVGGAYVQVNRSGVCWYYGDQYLPF